MKSFLILITLAVVFIVSSEAICCNWVLTSVSFKMTLEFSTLENNGNIYSQGMKAQCGDGSFVHPWQCCTTGSCNVFCCNCDQPCLSNPLVPLLRKAVNAEMDELEQALNDI